MLAGKETSARGRHVARTRTSSRSAGTGSAMGKGRDREARRRDRHGAGNERLGGENTRVSIHNFWPRSNTKWAIEIIYGPCRSNTKWANEKITGPCQILPACPNFGDYKPNGRACIACKIPSSSTYEHLVHAHVSPPLHKENLLLSLSLSPQSIKDADLICWCAARQNHHAHQ
jgi:hypothetical protein